jgi:hypothetical protein
VNGSRRFAASNHSLLTRVPGSERQLGCSNAVCKRNGCEVKMGTTVVPSVLWVAEHYLAAL